MPNRLLNLELSPGFSSLPGVAPFGRAGDCCEFYFVLRGELSPPASFSLQLLCSWLTAREFSGTVGPDPAAAGAAPAWSLHPNPSPEGRAPSRAGEGQDGPSQNSLLLLSRVSPLTGRCTGGSALHLLHKTDARQEVWLSLSLTHGHKSALLRLLTPPRSCCHCPFGAGKPTMTSPRCSPACLPPSLPALASLSLNRQRWSSLSSCLGALRHRDSSDTRGHGATLPAPGWARALALPGRSWQESFLQPSSGRTGKGSWCSLAAGGASWSKEMASDRRMAGRKESWSCARNQTGLWCSCPSCRHQ